MTDQDFDNFAIEFAILAEVFGEALSPIRTRAYFEDLSDWPLEWAIEGIRRARRTCRFFPKPVEIIQAADDAREENFQNWLAAERNKYALPPGQEPKRLSEMLQISGILPTETNGAGHAPA
jgi:hypothetical protein